MQWSKGQRERERAGERHPEQEAGRERGEGGNVLTLRFLSELSKLIISSGLAQQCQEQELLPGRDRPGSPPTLGSTPLAFPLFKPQPTAKLWGPNGKLPACLPALPVRAEPSLARCHGAFACSGVLIKSFIVFHSRKELRRNTEQNGAEG